MTQTLLKNFVIRNENKKRKRNLWFDFYPYHDTSFGCGDGENGRCSVGGPEFRVVVGVSHPPTMRTMPFVRGGIDSGAPVALRPCCNKQK